MATKRGARGARGIPGPAGPSGAKGDAGATGARGATGTAGPRGHHGLTGATGPSEGGIAGKSRIRLLTSIDKHIDNIYRELDTQITRTAKLQAQLDDLRAKIRDVIESQ